MQTDRGGAEDAEERGDPGRIMSQTRNQRKDHRGTEDTESEEENQDLVAGPESIGSIARFPPTPCPLCL